MRNIRAWFAGLCAAPAVAAALLAAAPAGAAEKMAGQPVVLLAGPAGPPSFVRPDVDARRAPVTAVFQVTYTGFPVAAKAAFQRAVNIWAQKVHSTVPITVSATYADLGDPRVLGQARAGNFWRDFPDARSAGTWYAEALASKFHGSQLDPATPDIVAQFNSTFTNWWFGTGPAPAGKFDFTSVVLHELGHGLGFSGFGRVSGSPPVGAIRLLGFPAVYDRFTENGAGKAMLSFPDPSATLAAQLQGNNLYFDSPAERAANNNLRAKLYAPSVFQPGSSYSHLDEVTYPKGNPNSLMTPALSPGETIRSPGPITSAIFATFGW